MKAQTTRKGFLGIIAGAAVAPVLPAAVKPKPEEDILVRMARLVVMRPLHEDRRLWVEFGLMAALREPRIFPVPDWLAEYPRWKQADEDDRAKADGTYCWEVGVAREHWQCGVCGERRGPEDPQHIAGEGKESKTCCPDCCPACRKRAGLPPKEPSPPKPEPTEQEIMERYIQRSLVEDRGLFASSLLTARSMLKKYPELVTAPEFPEPHFSAYREYYESDPSDEELDIDEDVLDPDYFKNLRAKAEEFAREHIARRGRV